jgi:hypothetical protein
MTESRPLSGRVLAGLALLTGAVLAAQIVLSRLLASTLGYYFAFMLVSLAMLGLGSGALIVHARIRWFRRETLERDSAVLSLLCAICACAGALAYLGVYVPHSRGELLAWLAPIFFCFFPFFLLSGIAVSLVLRHAGAAFHRAYAVDLLGAAAGAGAAVLLLSVLSPMDSLLQGVAVLPALAATLFALEKREKHLSRLAACGVALAAALLGVANWSARSPMRSSPAHVDWINRIRLAVEWNSFSSITVFRGSFFSWGLSETYQGPSVPMLDLIIDGIGGTQLAFFDGNPASLGKYEYLDADMSALGQELIPPSESQLVIGPGGGVDVLQAVHRGRKDIDAVEINPLMVELVNHRLANFSGAPYHLPGVRVTVENGRTFVERARKQWGLISLTWVDTGGSATALAASENYLYTVEAYEQFLRHLAPDGMLAFMRATGELVDQPIDTLRGISVTMEALERLGVERPRDHVLVIAVESPFFDRRGMCYVLVKRSPFTAAETARAKDFADRMHFRVVWLPGDAAPASPPPAGARPVVSLARQLILAQDRGQLYRMAPVDVQPATDDQPFYFVGRGGPERAPSEGLSLLWTCFWLLAALVAVFLGLPLAAMVRAGRVPPRSGAAFLAYCCLLGSAFMLVEMELFHVFALLLGSPTYALTAVLVGLLVFSGAGSACAPRYFEGRRIGLAFGGLLAALALFIAFRGVLLSLLLPLPFGARLTATLVLIAPLGFHMGLPMALGMRTAWSRPDWMTWGWALNGACSVLASVGAVLLAIHVGISATFGLGFLCYAAGWGLLTRSLLSPEATPEAQAATAAPA